MPRFSNNLTDIETLIQHRWNQALETLADAEKMDSANLSPRTVMNRAYYAMFYGALATFLKLGISIKTSKHSGIISIFDKELIRNGKLEKKFSKMFHDTFEKRVVSDYEDMKEISIAEAQTAVTHAKKFLDGLKKLF